jgi:hypothetical protein
VSEYNGPERRSRPRTREESRRSKAQPRDDNGEGLRVGWREWFIGARGPTTIVLVVVIPGFVVLGLGLHQLRQELRVELEAAEQIRRVIEQEARNEVQRLADILKANGQAIAYSCAVPELLELQKRIEAEYQRKLEFVNQGRKAQGLPPVYPQSIVPPSAPR